MCAGEESLANNMLATIYHIITLFGFARRIDNEIFQVFCIYYSVNRLKMRIFSIHINTF